MSDNCKRRATGKWTRAEWPHKGWHCADVEDLQEDGSERTMICEMCEVMEIRYVHHMEHPCGHRLRVGCICAGHMEGDVARAKGREQAFKRRAGRRKKAA
jgi:hypothetical protein